MKISPSYGLLGVGAPTNLMDLPLIPSTLPRVSPRQRNTRAIIRIRGTDNGVRLEWTAREFALLDSSGGDWSETPQVNFLHEDGSIQGGQIRDISEGPVPGTFDIPSAGIVIKIDGNTPSIIRYRHEHRPNIAIYAPDIEVYDLDC